MKKTMIILAFAIIVVLGVLVTGCGSGGDEDLSDSKYVGTWKAVSMSLGDEEGPLEGGEYILTVNADGTGTLEGTDENGAKESSGFTWKPTDDGFKTDGDVELKFKDKGDRISAKVIGVNLNFEKQ